MVCRTLNHRRMQRLTHESPPLDGRKLRDWLSFRVWTALGRGEYYRHPTQAPVAQLDRVSASEEVKQRFESGGKAQGD